MKRHSSADPARKSPPTTNEKNGDTIQHDLCRRGDVAELRRMAKTSEMNFFATNANNETCWQVVDLTDRATISVMAEIMREQYLTDIRTDLRNFFLLLVAFFVLLVDLCYCCCSHFSCND